MPPCCARRRISMTRALDTSRRLNPGVSLHRVLRSTSQRACAYATPLCYGTRQSQAESDDRQVLRFAAPPASPRPSAPRSPERTAHPTTSPPTASTSSHAALAVPPVASTSSTTSTRAACRARVLVHLEPPRPVLQRVVARRAPPRQLARLPDRDEPRPQRQRDRRREDEPAALDPRHVRDPLPLATARPSRRSRRRTARRPPGRG